MGVYVWFKIVGIAVAAATAAAGVILYVVRAELKPVKRDVAHLMQNPPVTEPVCVERMNRARDKTNDDIRIAILEERGSAGGRGKGESS